MLDLAIIFSNLGIVNGDTTAHNQYTFFKNIEWSDGSFTNNQFEFFEKIGGRYNFFKQYGSEYEFYKNISDPRIYNYTTFYKYGGEYLETGPQIPIVNFSVDNNLPIMGDTISFTDLSTNSPTSWLWDFGDGTTSTLQNPTHIYNSDSKFDVKLIATNSEGFGELIKVDFINVGIDPLSSFTADNLSPEPNDMITFTNTSIGTDISYLWDFGDGNTSTLENPTHSYTIEGEFDVSLEVTNLWGVDTETKVGYIDVEGIVPVASFTSDTQSIEPNETVTFTNTSTNGDTYLWDFGDGNTSTLKNPTHTYTTEGTFDVSLTATNIYGSDTETKVGYITSLGIVPVASFTADNLSPGTLDVVTFTNTSTDGDTYLWNFGDGNTSTLKNPTHTYTIEGTFDVSLTVTNIYGSDTETKVGYIAVSDISFNMKIDLSLPGGTTNGFKIPFTNNQTSFPLRINWGDGSSDIITSWNQVETEHIYSTSGIYDISIVGTIDDKSFQFNSSLYSRKLIEVGGILDITDGTSMFGQCRNLSQCNIISLDNLTNGAYMFDNNSLTSWNIELPNLEDGTGMFYFNGLTSWNVGLPNLTNGTDMFLSNTINTIDYSNLLIDLNTNNPNNNVAFHGGNSIYNSSGVSARDNLVSRGWAITDGGPVVITPVSNFNVDNDEPIVGTQIQFTDTSTNEPTSWLWDFGDGNTSTLKNPTHTYTIEGEFDVSLTSTNSAGSDTKNVVKMINAGIVPVSNFTADNLSPETSDIVTFTNTSTGSSGTYLWNFGDGNTSTLKNPTHTYTTKGTFDVSLMVTNLWGVDTETKVGYIEVVDTPVANFIVDNDTPIVGEQIQFTDTSINEPTSWSWDFGDGNTSTSQNPTHTYVTGGKFDVSLTSTNSAGSDTKTVVEMINVGVVPVSNFTADNLSPGTSDVVSFTNTSTNGDTYLWNFGDGNTSTLQNPTHTYTTEGSFDVSLEVTNLWGSDTETKVGYIEVVDIISFTMKIDLSKPGGTTNGFKIPFTNSQTSFPLEIDWGDGSSDSIFRWDHANLEHIYSTSGIYDISIVGTIDDKSIVFTSNPYRTKLTEVGGTLDITNGDSMFRSCSNLTQCNTSLDNLIVGTNMFLDCSLTSSWDIPLPNLENGSYMFMSNNLTSWTVGLPKLKNGTFMFYGITINTIDYSNLLIDLSANNPNNNVRIDSSSKYNSSAVSARSNLVGRGWTINDNGLG